MITHPPKATINFVSRRQFMYVIWKKLKHTILIPALELVKPLFISFL